MELWRCRNDEVLGIQPSAADPTTVELDLGDVPAATGCNSEIVVLAEGNAMALSFPGWSDAVNDSQHDHHETDHRRTGERLDRE